MDTRSSNPSSPNSRNKPRWNFSHKPRPRNSNGPAQEQGSPTAWGLTTEDKIDRMKTNLERWVPAYTSPRGLDREFPSDTTPGGQAPWEVLEERRQEQQAQASPRRQSPSAGKVSQRHFERRFTPFRTQF